jgi:penicillin-binding protein 2
MFSFKRLIIVLSGFFCIFIFILFEIFSLQTTDISELTETLEDQNLEIFYIPAPRGEIYDINNNLIASSNLESYLFINNKKISIENIDTYKQLIFYNFPELTEDEVIKMFNQKELLSKVISLETVSFEIRRKLLSFEAFEVIDLPIREYPYESLTAHIVGYIGKPSNDEVNLNEKVKGNNLIGKTGLEKTYENELSGIPGQIVFDNNEIINYIPPQSGSNIYTSVDIQLQEVVKESLIQGLELANKNFISINPIERGASIVLNIETGEVNAMVSLPDFDPNLFVSGISEFDYKVLSRKQAFNNFAIQGLYPPGSVFKVVAYWLANSESIFPEDKTNRSDHINCDGNLSFGFDDGSKQIYNDWKLSGHGKVNLTSAITQSCNVYFWDIALTIWRNFGNEEGESILQDYARELGFGKITNIDLPYESAGIVPDRDLFEYWRINQPDRVRPEGWLGGDLMNLIIGQGAITTTPIQVANAYRTLITGKNIPPHLNKNASVEINNLINVSDEFVAFLLKDLNTVTSSGGTAYKAFSILGKVADDTGGKTGTAQNPGDRNNTSWFVGIDSISNPKYIIVTVIDEGGSGSAIAAPVTRRIIQSLRGLELTSVEFGEVTE